MSLLCSALYAKCPSHQQHYEELALGAHAEERVLGALVHAHARVKAESTWVGSMYARVAHTLVYARVTHTLVYARVAHTLHLL